MAKLQPVWAIDIGQSALKAIKLLPSEEPGHAIAEAFDFIEYPKILSQPDADADELVQQALTTLLERNDMAGCRVSLAVSGQSGLVKFIKLPPVEKKRIPDIVKFEARQHIPFGLDEVIWDYQQITGAEEDKPKKKGKKDEVDDEDDFDFTETEVGLFAMKREMIYRAIEPLTDAGIEVDLIQMAPLALYNFAAFDQVEEPGGGKSVVVVDLGADHTDLIITDGVRIWQRNVAIGGNHFTRALTKELKLTFAKAEHLKRNATAAKSHDPRAVFKAMQGVYHDLAHEIGRSVGFFSSVNRGKTEISRVVGLGNGFKLPGLQKYLQQQLELEVVKLNQFDKLTGDVLEQPQFKENMASFAVAYGLGLQGLGPGPLQTNLLPPEIRQARLIRRKKPWALVAAALLLLGLTIKFGAGDFRVLASTKQPGFDSAVASAKSVTSRASGYESDYSTQKSQFLNKKTEGENLVVTNTGQSTWPQVSVLLSQAIPDQAEVYGLDPDEPEHQLILANLRIHIDAIIPVYVPDLRAQWFDSQLADLGVFTKAFMHPYDRNNPPEGEGWVIQIVGHHYNPSPNSTTKNADVPDTFNGLPTRFGPLVYLSEQILPRFQENLDLRLNGISHATLAWFQEDEQWTTDKGARTNGLSALPIPLMPRAAAAAPASGGPGGGRLGEGGGQMSGQGGMGAYAGAGGDADGGGMGSGEEYGEYGGMMGVGQGGGMGMGGGRFGGAFGGRGQEDRIDYLTRTDFMVHVVWNPADSSEEPETPEALQTKRQELIESLRQALQDAGRQRPFTLEDLNKASREASQRREQQLRQGQQQADQTPEGEEPNAAEGEGEASQPSAPATN